MNQHYTKIATNTLLEILSDTLSENRYEGAHPYWAEIITSCLKDHCIFKKGTKLIDILEDIAELSISYDGEEDTSETSNEIIGILRSRACKQ